MPLTVPLTLVQFPGQFFDLAGDPLAGGLIQFYAAGTVTPQNTYADVNGSALNTNPVVCDGNGYATIFLLPTLYDVVVKTSAAVTIRTVLGVGNPGQIVFAGLGNTLASGGRNKTSGYAITSSDQLVTMQSTAGPNPCLVNLPAAATRSSTNAGNGLPLVIKNIGVIPLSIVPAGADTIEGLAAAYAVAGSTSPLYRTVRLLSDGVSGWWIDGGIGV